VNDEVSIYAPFAKGQIDVAKRIVYGIAQLEEAKPDLQGDIVDFGATKRAFGKWAGNVREMHGPKAVGRALFVKALDPEKQMVVGVHVSRGAEDTWQKVLDGTLRGFSIGGHANRTSKTRDKSGRLVNKVLEYTLTELSLVDVPANPKCKIMAVQKNFVAPGIAGGERQRKMDTPALDAIKEMAKSMGDDDEVIIIKRADMTVQTEQVDGKDVETIVLKNDAKVSDPISKADLGALAEPATTVDETESESAIVSVAKGFISLCKSLGADPAATFAAAAEADETNLDGSIAKNFGGRTSTDEGTSVTEERVTEIVSKAVGDAIGGLAGAIDDIKKSITSTPLARKGSGDGTVIKKNDGETEPDGEAVETLKKNYTEAVQKRDGLIAKMNAKQPLTTTEEAERQSIGETIDRLEVELAHKGVQV
jgi:Putative phage serine protease XkdF